MTLAWSKSLARWTGFLVGLGLAVWIVLLGRVPAHSGAPAARLTMAAKPTQKLLVEPAGKNFLSASSLRPSPPERGPTGRFDVMNLTRRPMLVAVAARPSSKDLDSLLQVEITAARRRVFRGSLQELRSWSAHFRLAPSRQKRLEVRAWLPLSVGSRYQGRFVDVRLKWRTRGGRR